jgi:rubredoxin
MCAIRLLPKAPMADDFLFLSSQFARWCFAQQRIDLEQLKVQREEALVLLVECINTGEITSLDGIQSSTSLKIKDHHGIDDLEMNSHWIGSSQDWTCPCCGRSKFQVSRLGKKQQILAKLVIHHDHMGEALQAAFHAAFVRAGTDVEQIDGLRLVERVGHAFAAYEEVLVCEDCNNADADAKKLVSAPPFFSFSIGQIHRFIQSGEHQPHRVDVATAQHTWEDARPAYELRMKLINAVARAAATDTHWYEPHKRGTRPIPVLGYVNRTGDAMIKDWVSTEALYKALGPQPKKADRNLARWRTTLQKPGQPLPPNYLAMLRSEEAFAQAWDTVSDDWSCPVCGRGKQQVVYVDDKGKVVFFLASSNGRGTWSVAPRICRQCHSTLMSLKLEITELTGNKPPDSYGFVSPSELASIIDSRPHSQHATRRNEAAVLVERISQRLRDGASNSN